MIWFWDGFENPNNPAWTLGGTFYLPTLQASGGRLGGAFKITDTHNFATLSSLDPLPGYAFGFAVKPEGITQPVDLFTIWGDCNIPEHDYERWGGLAFTAGGQLCWRVSVAGGYLNDDWTLSKMVYMGASIRAGMWTHIEVHIYNGYVTLWVDGLYLGAIACDTINHVNLIYPYGITGHFPLWPPKLFQLGGESTWQRQDCPAVWFDDFYCATRPTPDAPIGDLIIEKFFPSLDGNYQDWHPSVAGDHYAMVDEDPHDGDSSYVYAEEADINAKDTYAFNVVARTGIPLSAMPFYMVRKTNIGARALRAISRLDGVDEFSDPFPIYSDWPLDAYKGFPIDSIDPMLAEFPNDPSAADWTWESLNDAEFGMDVYS
jgi:hypothetical protein